MRVDDVCCNSNVWSHVRHVKVGRVGGWVGVGGGWGGWCVFFFNDTATTEIYTLSLHDALPICKLHQ